MKKDAVIDESGHYRYLLSREWGKPAAPRALFVMLNPSTADAEKDDPTIRRCIGFAQRWNYAALDVVNLYGYRSTRPQELRRCLDPIGDDNDAWIKEAAGRAMTIIAAWGAHAWAFERGKEVAYLIDRWWGIPLWCLGTTKNGGPRHPLYVPVAMKLQPYRLEVKG